MTNLTDQPIESDETDPLKAPITAETSQDILQAPANQVVTPGELLREGRLASGMHLATLSMVLKVPIKKLEALESNDWVTLPDPVFVRAIATSVCRHIKLDSAPVLALLPSIPRPAMLDDVVAKGLNQRFVAAGDPKPSLLRAPVSLPMLLGAVIFLLAAVVLIFLPELAQRTNQKNSEITQVLPTVPSNPTQPDQVVTPALAEPVPVANPAAMPAVPSEPVAVIAATATPTLPTLKMVAKGVVWVEVKDSKGGLLVQRTLQPKEVVNATGTPPLSVVIGRINEIESMDVRGKPYSLAGLSPDNVARIEIK